MGARFVHPFLMCAQTQNTSLASRALRRDRQCDGVWWAQGATGRVWRSYERYVMKSIEEIREFFSHDAFATNAGGYIEEVGDKYSVCSMPIDERHMNAVGNVMGGVYFTLADFAFAVATNHEKPSTVSLDSTINFMSIARGDKIYAKAECIRDGRTTCVYIIKITDASGKLVAQVTTTGHKAV